MAETSPPQASRSNPPRTRRLQRLSSTQVMFAIIVAIGLILALQFSSRISAERDLNRIRDTIQEEINLLQREQSDLIDQLAFVESDAYVEAWAHREGRMIREGEVLVIPIPSEATLTQPTPAEDAEEQRVTIETTDPQPENWQLWWSLFFDAPPPSLDG